MSVEYADHALFAPGGTSETVIAARPTHLHGFIGKTGTGTLTLRDSKTAAGATTTFPVYTLAVGTMVSFPRPVRLVNGLTAQLGTGTDAVTLLYSID